MNRKSIIEHYDRLIDDNNDPFHDPQPLKEYMDGWDGQTFINELSLNCNSTALEIGVGTGRLAVKIAPLCKKIIGIDISSKTINRAKENLSSFKNIELICDDFLDHSFLNKFDVIYSSLTFLHIENKEFAIKKVTSLLNINGKVVISLDKNQNNYIEYGNERITTYPDDPENIKKYFISNGLKNIKILETEFAFIISAKN